jgi:hypothetical protein
MRGRILLRLPSARNKLVAVGSDGQDTDDLSKALTLQDEATAIDAVARLAYSTRTFRITTYLEEVG